MLEITGDLFEQKCDAICITTNGFVKKNGEAVMGAGVAKQAADRWITLPKILGKCLLAGKDGVNTLLESAWDETPYEVVSFPVKPKYGIYEDGSDVVKHMRGKFHPLDRVPGWACTAKLWIIEKSCRQLVKLADEMGWKTVCLPRPGCGAGELEWLEVLQAIKPLLDDRFVIVHKEGK